MRIAVIVTTYNRPDALNAVLAGYLAQTDLNFELIIADDGSDQKTRNVVQTYQAVVPFSFKHVWHEDKGFRAAAIRNRAILATDADYIIFTDGDCIPQINFVEKHRQLAKAGYFVAGSRLLSTESFTEMLLEQSDLILQWNSKQWLKARLHKQVNRVLPLFNMPHVLDCLRYLQAKRWKGAKTCNLGVWRDDLVKINGLDEMYTGWGMEDSDLVIRLLNLGIKHKSGRFATAVLHLWHKENDRSLLQKNIEQLNDLIVSNRTKAYVGLDRY